MLSLVVTVICSKNIAISDFKYFRNVALTVSTATSIARFLVNLPSRCFYDTFGCQQFSKTILVYVANIVHVFNVLVGGS